MSQSPVNSFSEEAVVKYQQGWQALNRLLHENRSFSGNERHCAFLNGGQGQFANVSSVIGLDFAEDGRALGSVDWDFDGDLDLWITNRTAPRVRFMRNEVETDNGFLALHLIGDGKQVNRDAIGTRVEVVLDKPLIKTKRAGEGFLTQSSGWMHFGLGKQTQQPVTVRVRWPNGQQEAFVTVAVNQFHILSQGTGKAVVWQPPAVVADFAKAAAPMVLPEPEAGARIVLPEGLAMPTLTSLQEEEIVLGKKPVLVNVWASFCRPCLAELAEWTASAEVFANAGLEVIALNADDQESGRKKADTILEKLGFPFRAFQAAPETYRALDILQRSTLDLWETLPVPCSFLVDPNGYLLAIYKGPVPQETLFNDLALMTLSPAERRMASVPYKGVWTHDPPTPDPLRVSSQFVDHDLVEQGLAYLSKATEMDRRLRADRFSDSIFADRYFVMATLLRAQGKNERAVATYRQAQKLNPKDVRIPSDLGDFLQTLKRPQEAVKPWREALALNPNDLKLCGRLAMTHLRLRQPKQALPFLDHFLEEQPNNTQILFYRGLSLQQMGQVNKALTAFEKVLKINPNYILAANNLTWLLSAHPDASVRNADRAVELAKQVSARSRNRDPNYLSTVAVALANAGDYQGAIAQIDTALGILAKLKPSAAVQGLTKSLTERKSLFESGKPFRDLTLKAKVL